MISIKRIISTLVIFSIFSLCGNYVIMSPVDTIKSNQMYHGIIVPNDVLMALTYIPQEHRNIVLAICYVESRFTGNVISATGDYGIMQINMAWHSKEFDFSRMLDNEYNIYCGYIIFLRCLTLANNDTYKALMYYNGSKEYPKLFKQLI